MWDKIWGYINQALSMGRRLEDTEEDIARLSDEASEDRRKDELRDEKVNAIAQALQRFALEYEHDHKNAETEREMQRLRLEVLLLQGGNRLSPGQPPNAEIEALRETVEQLQRENAELQQRLEQSEQKINAAIFAARNFLRAVFVRLSEAKNERCGGIFRAVRAD